MSNIKSMLIKSNNGGVVLNDSLAEQVHHIIFKHNYTDCALLYRTVSMLLFTLEGALSDCFTLTDLHYSVSIPNLVP